MTNRIMEVRLTLFAFINALEQDLRTIIRGNIIEHFQDEKFLKDQELIERTKKRFLKDRVGLNPNENIDALIDYIDFQDSYKVILSNRDVVPPEIINEIKRLSPQFDTIAPIRNRVYHGRPLLTGDFFTVYAFLSNLKPSAGIPWSASIYINEKIEKDPTYVFGLQIPFFERLELKIFNNLPLPDFDETGLVGRTKDCQDVINLMLGPHPVITIVGDGGIGKTALMLKVAYDILDMEDSCPFDIISWISCKTSMLTSVGVQDIKDSIRDFVGIIENIASSMGSPKIDLEHNMAEILEYMNNFKILLILDNLETIHDDRIMDFIQQASNKCKIAITSRIGLGNYENRRLLNGLSESESVTLIHEVANIRNSQVLKKFSTPQLASISKQLHYNPLALKWFVNSVELGKHPNDLLNNKDDLLSFCLENVYTQLIEQAKLVISTLIVARKNLTDAELIFLTELDPITLRKALHNLFSTTLVKREILSTGDSIEYTYSITDFAKEYLLRKHAPNAEFVKKFIIKNKQLIGVLDEVKRITVLDAFSINSLSVKNSQEGIVAKYLQEALILSKRERYDDALQKIDDARDITPQYAEIYTISAFIKKLKGNIVGASEDYKIGLQIEPDNQKLLYYYAGLLLFDFQDSKTALLYGSRLYALNPDEPAPAIMYARCVGYEGNYPMALEVLRKIDRTKISIKYKKITYTLMIDFCRRWAEADMKINEDYQNAFLHIQDTFPIFDNAAKDGVVDDKMLTEFLEAFDLYVYVVWSKEKPETKANLIENIKKYSLYLLGEKAKNTREGICLKFTDISNLLDSSHPSRTIIKKNSRGKIDIFDPQKTFVFIKGEDGIRYFMHRSTLCNEKWSNLEKGVAVSFDIATHPKGQCAVNVKIIS